MKFNYKKIASVLASAIMLSSTVGFAAAASTYPAPFVSGGSSNGAVIVGANAAPSDWALAIDVGQKLSALVTSSAPTSAGASGGDSVSLGTSSRKIYYGDAINAGRTSLTNTELPNVLSGNKFTDLAGTQYSYTQTISPGPAAITFGTSGGDLPDPTLYIDAGNNGGLTNGWLYNYTLSFSKNINVSDSVNVQGQKIKILGVDYVIGSGSTNTTLYLYGSGETITVSGGEESKVTVGGTEHTIELITTSSATAGTLKVDGVSKSVTEGSSYAFAGSLNVFVKDIIHPAYAGDIRQAELIVGSNTLIIANAATVKQGSDQTTIKSTLGTVTAAGNGYISGFSVAIGAPKTQTDSIKVGESFTDPVFGGLKVQFADVVPDLADTARDKVVVNTDNTQYAYVTLTTARAGDKGEQKLTYAYDNDTAAATASPLLAHQSGVNSNGKGYIHVLEGESALQNDWIVVNQGDAGTILNVDDISTNTVTEATVTLSDVITGESQKITLTTTNGMYGKTGVNFFGGNGYNIYINPTTNASMNITWTTTANTRTLFPRIKLKGGGWMAFLASTIIPNNTNVLFPNGLTTISTTGVAGGAVGNLTLTYAANGITWGLANYSLTSDGIIQNITNPSCNFNSTRGPAILLIEPKRWNDANTGNFICVPMTTSGTTEIAIARSVLNGTASTFTSYSTDNYKSQAMDQYGSLITDEQRTNENGVATIAYPASQMYADVLFTAEAVTVTPGSAGGGSGGQVLVVKDTQVDSVSDKNLFVIGGSCINEVAAKVLGKDTPVCGNDFSALTKVSAGGYIIKTVESPYNAAKVATLVAGYNADDTSNAVAKVLTGVATDKGTSMTYPEVATA